MCRKKPSPPPTGLITDLQSSSIDKRIPDSWGVEIKGPMAASPQLHYLQHTKSWVQAESLGRQRKTDLPDLLTSV